MNVAVNANTTNMRILMTGGYALIPIVNTVRTGQNIRIVAISSRNANGRSFYKEYP